MKWLLDLYHAIKVLPSVVLRLDELLKRFDRHPTDFRDNQPTPSWRARQ